MGAGAVAVSEGRAGAGAWATSGSFFIVFITSAPPSATAITSATICKGFMPFLLKLD